MSIRESENVEVSLPASFHRYAHRLAIVLQRPVEVYCFDPHWRLGDVEVGGWVISHEKSTDDDCRPDRPELPWHRAEWDFIDLEDQTVIWSHCEGEAGWLTASLGKVRDERWVACASVSASERPLALAGALGVMRAEQQAAAVDRLSEQISELREENNSLAQQISEDFEELLLLRAIAEHLEICDLEHDVGKMGSVLLPRLCRSVKAVSIALIPASGSEHSIKFDELPVWSGEQVLAGKACWDLVREFLPEVARKPVVRNGRNAIPQQADFRDLHNVVIVPLARAQQIYGFLLAANHTYLVSGTGYRAKWQLSQNEFGTEEATLLSSVAAFMAAHASNVGLFAEKEQLLTNIIRSLVTAIDAKDKYTRGHSERVALYGRCLAKRAGYDAAACKRMYLTGLLHDVGKIGISDSVLKKPGRLTVEEFDEIKRHPDEGWSILSDLQQLAYVLPGVLFHHERFDGMGYPDGLRGENIPLDGRILAVVDAYDAMTSDRPYRQGMPHDQAINVLERGSGTQWDPELMDMFFEIMPSIRDIKANYCATPKPERVKGYITRELSVADAQEAIGCRQQ